MNSYPIYKSNGLLYALLVMLLLIPVSVDARIPVTYSCCKNYISDQGTLLDGFERLDGWTLNGLNSSYIIDDTINFKEGLQGLKLVAKSGKVYATRSIYKDFSKTKNFAFDVYIYNATTIGYITFYFSSHTDWSKYFSYTIDSSFLNGWNHFVIKKSDIFDHGDDWNNTMTMFRLAVNPVIGRDTNVTIDNFRYDTATRAKVIITFDDGTISDFENAEPILNSNNQKAASFVAVNKLNSPGFMTLDRLKMLQSAGWDISSHTMSHRALTGLNDSDLTIELNNSYDWLVENGFQKSAGFLAYPYGYWNENVVARTKQRYIFSRGVQKGIEPQLSPYYKDNLYKLKIMEARSNTTFESIKELINSTISQGGLSILLFHEIVDNNPTTYQYSKSKFKKISDYIKSRSSDIDVITFSDYMNANINKFTPVINKTVRIYPNGTSDLMTDNKYDEYMPNMTIKPSKGFIDVSMNVYDETEEQFLSFNETASDSAIEVWHSVGYRNPGKKYAIKTYWNNGTLFQDFYMITDAKGYINYYSTGFYGPGYTEIRPLIATDKIPDYRENEYEKDIVLPAVTESTQVMKASGFEEIELIVILTMLFIYITRNKK